MAGAILALAAVFAVTIAVQTGVFLLGAVLFPVGFCMLYLMAACLYLPHSLGLHSDLASRQNKFYGIGD